MSERAMTPEVFTADYSGEPGRRAFFLQGRTGEDVLTFRIEKDQVGLLAEKLTELLLLIDKADGVSGAMPKRDPNLGSWVAEPEWRVGTIGLSYDETNDRVVISLESVVTPGESEADGAGELDDLDEPDDIPEGELARFTLSRDQVRAFVLHALAIVGEGRPLCQLCGLPIDPGGHACPASNGHHPHV